MSQTLELRNYHKSMFLLLQRKNGRFSVIGARIGSIVILGQFFDGLDSPTKFRWKRSKIKGTYTSDWGVARNSQKQGWAPKNDP